MSNSRFISRLPSMNPRVKETISAWIAPFSSFSKNVESFFFFALFCRVEIIGSQVLSIETRLVNEGRIAPWGLFLWHGISPFLGDNHVSRQSIERLRDDIGAARVGDSDGRAAQPSCCDGRNGSGRIRGRAGFHGLIDREGPSP